MPRLLIFSLAGSFIMSAAMADDFPAGPQHDLVAQSCTKCHVAGKITSQHKTADEWADIVSQMIVNGAKVSDADFDNIVDYLAQNFGPAGTGPAKK